MRNIYIVLIYLLVIICGGCAVSEVLFGQGTGWGLFCVMAGLSIILYILKLPVETEGDY